MARERRSYLGIMSWKREDEPSSSPTDALTPAHEDAAQERPPRRSVPWWIKAAYTLLVVVLVPIWIRVQGLENFLWFSDIALLGTCVALWLENRMLASMMALAAIIPDLGWGVQYFGQLLIDAGPFERSGFMFDDDLPIFVRALSLYHLLLPPLLVWLVARLGYDRRALPLQTLLAAVVLFATWRWTDPSANINFAFGFGDPPEAPLPQPWWFGAQLLILFVGAYLPTHLFLSRWRIRGEASRDDKHD